MAIFLITAPSGSGKTTIAQSLQSKGSWEECVSHTTRPMRAGEEDGVTYYFTERDKFIEMLENGEFAENVEYDGNLYAISKEEIKRVESKNKHVFVIVEYNGYKQMKEIYPDAIGIFLYMSKEDCMANMLLRGDSIENAIKRISTYDEEMKNIDKYDYVVKNVRNKKDWTERIIVGIIHQHE